MPLNVLISCSKIKAFSFQGFITSVNEKSCAKNLISSNEMNGFEVFQMARVFLVNFVLNSALVLSLSSTLHRQLWCLSLGFLKLWRIQNEKKEAVLPFRGKKTLLLIRTAFFHRSCYPIVTMSKVYWIKHESLSEER